jgi:hypothetical protein
MDISSPFSEAQFLPLLTISNFDLMKSISFKINLFWLVFLGGMSCVEPYEPPTIENGAGILVVDGSLNTIGKSTIRLTRSQNLSETSNVNTELNALVSFEDETGSAFILTEDGNGNYSLPQQIFSLEKKYRVKIQTADSKEYASEFVPVVKNPSIDSVSWKVTSENGVQVYVNTHDPENKTQYYRWDYEESWKYVSAFNSRFDWLNGYPVLRTNDIYNCYQTKPSGKIVIGSTARLSQNLISNFPLVYMEQRSEKIRFKYSILVKQFGLTKEAYEYWLQLQKNTESLGTLFDPQPSQLTGNLTCISDPSEPVLGYFIAGSASEERIFISSDNLPRASTYITSFSNCISLDTLFVFLLPLPKSKDFLIESLPSGPGTITAYSYTSAACADCRTAGGTTIKPDFWQ